MGDKQRAHGFELRLRLLPLLFLHAVAQQTASCIQMAAVGSNLHAAERDKQVGLTVQEKGSGEPAVVAA